MSGDVFSSEDSENFANNIYLISIHKKRKKRKFSTLSSLYSKGSRTMWCLPKIADKNKKQNRDLDSLGHLTSDHTFYTKAILTFLALEEIVFAISPSR